MSAPPPASPTCLNCGQAAQRYCSSCGQKNVVYRQSVRRLAGELGSELFALDSRLLRTLVPFLFRPGELTRAYNDGHRARYVPPLRLYLFASLLCFLVLGVRDLVSPIVDLKIKEGARAQTEAPAEKFPLAVDDEARERAAADPNPGGIGLSTQRGLVLPEPWMQLGVVRELNRRAENFGELPPERQSAILHDGTLSYAPTAIFLLLPFYALLLQVAFLGTGRYYVEHFVFALHLHAFVFLMLALSTAIGVGLVTTLCTLAVPVYALFALRHAYASGWPATLLRASFVSTGYLVLVIVGVLLVLLASVVLQG